MLMTPKKYTMVAAGAEGPSELNAFDNALLAAGIGNLNLLRVSSIMPPNCESADTITMAPGSLTPTAYGTITSSVPGELIAAAIGIGWTKDSYGVIMEFEGHCTREEAEATVAQMVRDAFVQRNEDLVDLKVLGVEHRVKSIGCVFAAVALWY